MNQREIDLKEAQKRLAKAVRAVEEVRAVALHVTKQLPGHIRGREAVLGEFYRSLREDMEVRERLMADAANNLRLELERHGMTPKVTDSIVVVAQGTNYYDAQKGSLLKDIAEKSLILM